MAARGKEKRGERYRQTEGKDRGVKEGSYLADFSFAHLHLLSSPRRNRCLHLFIVVLSTGKGVRLNKQQRNIFSLSVFRQSLKKSFFMSPFSSPPRLSLLRDPPLLENER